MKMKVVLIGVCFGTVLFSSCKTEISDLDKFDRAEVPKEQVLVEDSVLPQAIDYNLTGPIIDSILLARFSRKFSIPFHIDTNQLEDFIDDKDGKELTLEDYKWLTTGFTRNIRSERNDWYLEQMVKFKNMSKSKFQEYEDQLDIGQLRFSKIYPYGNVKISDSTNLLVLYMRHRTMDACPFGFGQVFYGTLMTSNHIQCSMPIAEFSGGGDPPIFGEVKMDFLIDLEGNIVQEFIESETDEVLISEGDYDLKTINTNKTLNGSISRDTIFSDVILKP
jgi:hypothetical protein